MDPCPAPSDAAILIVHHGMDTTEIRMTDSQWQALMDAITYREWSWAAERLANHVPVSVAHEAVRWYVWRPAPNFGEPTQEDIKSAPVFRAAGLKLIQPTVPSWILASLFGF